MLMKIVRSATLAAIAMTVLAGSVEAASVRKGFVKEREAEGVLTSCFCDDGMRAIDWRPGRHAISWAACKNACMALGGSKWKPKWHPPRVIGGGGGGNGGGHQGGEGAGPGR